MPHGASDAAITLLITGADIMKAETEERGYHLPAVETDAQGKPKLTTSYQRKEREMKRKDALSVLRQMLVPGQTVFVTVRHVSRSGLSLIVTPWILVQSGPTAEQEPLDITQLVRHACGIRFSTRHLGLQIDGYDLEVTEEIRRSLGWVVFQDVGALKAKKF
jgi:hypothetical protein